MPNFCDCNHNKFKSWYAFYKNETVVVRARDAFNAKNAAAVALGVPSSHQRYIKVSKVTHWGKNTDNLCDQKIK